MAEKLNPDSSDKLQLSDNESDSPPLKTRGLAEVSAICPPNTNREHSKRARDGRRRNNMQHGLCSNRVASLGGVPKGASYVGRLVGKLRRELENNVEVAKGKITLTDALVINTACRWERHAMLANRWLAKNCEKMTFDQRLNYSRDIAKAAENRDRAIGKLNLDQTPESIIGQLYAPLKPSQLFDDDA